MAQQASNESGATNGGTGRTFATVVLFTLLVIGFYVAVGVYVQGIVGDEGSGAAAAAAEGVSPEAGEAIFWGKGKCSTCHAVGDRGSAVRCPDLADIGLVAEDRASAAGVADGTTYLVESLHDPAAYVVDGYSGDTMPKVFQPPISLTGDEVRAVITYLQSLGGEPDAAAISLPADMESGGGDGAAAAAEAWAPYMTGDPERGRELFFDGFGDDVFGEGGPASCGVCHIVGDEGGTVGPELDDVALIRGPQYVIESIVDPQAEIVADYPPAMPTTFAERLSVKDIHDILAYLMESAGMPVETDDADSESGEGADSSAKAGAATRPEG